MRLLAVGSASALVCLLATTPAPAAADPGCEVLQVRVAGANGPTTVHRVRLPGNSTTRLGRLPFRLDAVGYAATQDLVYGMASGRRVIVIDGYGRMRDLGVPNRGGGARLPTGAEAGAIDGTNWYLRSGSRLYTVDVDPGSRDYLRVVRVRQLRPARLAGVADFATGERGGRLRAVTVSGRGDVIAVSMNPADGSIRPEPSVQLPAALSFDSIVVGPDGTLYAAARKRGGGTWFAISGSGAVRTVGSVPDSARGDAAGCLPALRRLPGPAPARPDAPERDPAQPLPPIPPPRPLPPPQDEQPAPDSPRDPETPEVEGAPQQQEEVAMSAEQDRTAQKRGWALTVILLIFGAAAAARRH